MSILEKKTFNNPNPSENEHSDSNLKKWYSIFLIVSIFIFIISIYLPLYLVNLNQTSDCSHHLEELGGINWIIGRSLGFSTFSWFIITIIIGSNTKKITKLFRSYTNVKILHCSSAIITNVLFIIHVIILLNSDPWGPLIFQNQVNHFQFIIFLIKIWTGIIFGIFMVLSTVLFFYLRDQERLKRFTYKRLIRIHYIMFLFTLILAVHIFLINTEIRILFWY